MIRGFTNKNKGNANQNGEVFFIKPIILGGDPNDPKNRTILTREQHIKAVRYWNEIISRLKNSK